MCLCIAFEGYSNFGNFFVNVECFVCVLSKIFSNAFLLNDIEKEKKKLDMSADFKGIEM